jgi:hypothetical protein
MLSGTGAVKNPTGTDLGPPKKRRFRCCFARLVMNAMMMKKEKKKYTRERYSFLQSS